MAVGSLCGAGSNEGTQSKHKAVPNLNKVPTTLTLSEEKHHRSPIIYIERVSFLSHYSLIIYDESHLTMVPHPPAGRFITCVPP